MDKCLTQALKLEKEGLLAGESWGAKLPSFSEGI